MSRLRVVRHDDAVPKPLTRLEVEALAESIAALLADPDAGLTDRMRLRWEGALAAVEAVLGRPSTLFGDERL